MTTNTSTQEQIQATILSLNSTSALLQREWQLLEDEREKLSTIAKDLAKKKQEFEILRKEFAADKASWEQKKEISEHSEDGRVKEQALQIKALKKELEETRRLFQLEREEWHGKASARTSTPAGHNGDSPLFLQYKPLQSKLLYLIGEFLSEIRVAGELENDVNKTYAVNTIRSFVTLQNDINSLIRGNFHLETYLAEKFTPAVKNLANSVKIALSGNSDYKDVESLLTKLKEEVGRLGEKIKSENKQQDSPTSPTHTTEGLDAISNFTPLSSTLSTSTSTPSIPSVSKPRRMTAAATVSSAKSPAVSSGNVFRLSSGPRPKVVSPRPPEEARPNLSASTSDQSSAGNTGNTGDGFDTAVDAVLDTLSSLEDTDESESTNKVSLNNTNDNEKKDESRENESYTKASTSSMASIHATVSRGSKLQRGKFEHLFDTTLPTIKDESSKKLDSKTKESGDSEKKRDGEIVKNDDIENKKDGDTEKKKNRNSEKKKKDGGDSDKNNGKSPKKSTNSPIINALSSPQSSTPNISSTNTPTTTSKEKWKCGSCTVINDIGATLCAMCGTAKGASPTAAPLPTTALSPRTTDWKCYKCKVINKAENKNCTMCGNQAPSADEEESETVPRISRSKSAGSVKKKIFPKMDEKKNS